MFPCSASRLPSHSRPPRQPSLLSLATVLVMASCSSRVGGAPEEYTAKGLQLCGGPGSRVVVVAYATGNLHPHSKGEIEYDVLVAMLKKSWTDAGAINVTVLDLETDEGSAIAAVEAADYIFFDGGDQKTLLKWMDGAPAVMAAIRRRHAAGALVGGMSAGAAAMPALMIKGGETADLTAIKSGGTEIGAGLGFWPEVITDQHFVKRQRFARLVSAVLDNPAFPGIAIDEETAILVSGDSFEVFGKGGVIVIDARHTKVGKAAKGEVQSGRGMRMSVLRAGDRFDWKKGK